MGKPTVVFVFLGVVAALLLSASAAWGHQRKADLVLAIDTIAPGVTCPTKPDNGTFKLDKWVIAGSLPYKRYAGTYPASVTSTAATAIDAAFTTWEGTDLAERFTGANDTGTPTVAADGTNAVFFAPLGGNAIATTYVWYNRATRKVAEFDMVFNSNLTWGALGGSGDCVGGTAFDVQDIATHEAGHVVGVAHTSPNGANNSQSMYPYGQPGEIYKRSLASGDIAGANAKY